jgi:hypothetical protein
MLGVVADLVGVIPGTPFQDRVEAVLRAAFFVGLLGCAGSCVGAACRGGGREEAVCSWGSCSLLIFSIGSGA